MAWIESHQTIGQHPKTRRAARSLGVSLPTLIGHLHLLWHWALDYAQDGDLSGYDAADIADAAMWDDDPALFLDALLTCGAGDAAGFLARVDGRLVIHDWWDYAGKLVAKRQADAERKRQSRQAPSDLNEETVRDMSTGRPTDGAATAQVTVTQPLTQPTGRRENEAPAGALAPTPIIKPEIVTEDRLMWDAFGDALGRSPTAKPERGKWNSGIKALRDAGITHRDVPDLVADYRAAYGSTIPCNPAAVAGNLSQIQGARASPQHSRNGRPNTTMDDLAARYQRLESGG